MQERQEITQQEKIYKSIRKSNKKQIEEKIRKDHSIFDKENSCKEPMKKKNLNKKKLYSENIDQHNKESIIKNNYLSAVFLFNFECFGRKNL